ncbi:MAG: hypothetical protein M1822_002637 [Bathelium mastoideum]|nr:MAG: hypothetical protein M1822_002637 [Bathelium mastoideum]
MGTSQSKELLNEGWESVEKFDEKDWQDLQQVNERAEETQQKSAGTEATEIPVANKAVASSKIQGPVAAATSAISKSTASAELAKGRTDSAQSASQSLLPCKCKSSSKAVPCKRKERSAQREVAFAEQLETNRSASSPETTSLNKSPASPTKSTGSQGSAPDPLSEESGKPKYEVKEGYRSSWKPDNQTYPNGILKNQAAKTGPVKLYSNVDGHIERRETSPTDPRRQSALRAHLQDQARRLYNEMVDHYPTSPEATATLERFLNRPDITSTALQHMICWFEEHKKRVDRTDAIAK